MNEHSCQISFQMVGWAVTVREEVPAWTLSSTFELFKIFQLVFTCWSHRQTNEMTNISSHTYTAEVENVDI